MLAFPILLASAGAAPEFQAPQDFPAPRIVAGSLDGEFRAHGDFDADGDIDVLQFTGSVLGWTGYRVFTNDGVGNLTAGPVANFNFPAAYTSGALQPFVADFDGDGRLDFAIARDGSAAAAGEGVEFFLGDGAGSFPTRHLVAISTPRWVAVGNLDGDAAAEIAVDNTDANFDRRLGWIDFQGGVPVRLPTLLVTPGVVPSPFVFTVVDVDGNGSDDIVATANTAANFDTVQFFPSVAGVPTVGASFSMPLSMRNVNHRIHAGDLDLDGDRDLLVLKMTVTDPGPELQVYERTAIGWTQRPSQVVLTPNTTWIQPHTSVLADWNGDFLLDVVSGSSRLDVLQNVGGLVFAQGFEALSTGQQASGGAFDIDGDGDADFVGSNSILFGNGTFVLPTTEPLLVALPRVRDLEEDGDLDFVNNGQGFFLRNDGTGAFTLGQRFFPSPGGNTWGAPIAYADFDGNGRKEHLAMLFFQPFPSPMAPFTPLGMWRIEDDGNDGFLLPVAATVSPDIIPSPTAVVTNEDPNYGVADIDNDGDLDLLITGGYRENDGTGMLSTFVAAWSGRARMAGDVDGDGRLDVVSTEIVVGGTQVVVWRNTTAGFVGIHSAVVAGRANARLVDLDGDSDLDLAVAPMDVAGLHLYENLGGAFATATPLPFAKIPYIDRIGIRDLDSDGILDLVLPAQATGPLGAIYDTIAHLRGTGVALGFDRVSDYVVFGGTLGLLDIDADGDFDSVGASILRGTRAPVDSGRVRQFGEGGVGTAGIRPVLGSTGPVISTSSQDELRIVRGTAGAIAILAFGLIETTITTPFLPGLFVHVGDPEVVVLPPLAGNPALVAGGELQIPLPNLPLLAGFTVVAQVLSVDAGAPSGWAASNGLAITFGL
jgi:hypothetical protein